MKDCYGTLPQNFKKIETGEDKTSIPKEMDIKDYIYIQKDGEIVRLKINFDHMSIVNGLEEYIGNQNAYKFNALDEDQIKQSYNISAKFFPYIGKYRLEGNVFKTENYNVPEKTEFLSFLISAYNNNTLNQNILFDLHKNCKNATIENDNMKKKILFDILSKITIEVEDKYTLEEINTTLNFMSKFPNNINLCLSLRNIKSILESVKENTQLIPSIGLQEKIDEVINLSKKVK